MNRYYSFCCLAQLIIVIGGQPAWGNVLSSPPGVVLGIEGVHANLFSEEVVCCDQQINDSNGKDKVQVAQLFEIITGAAKLIYSATDKTKENEEAAKAAELQRQAEEKAQLEEQNKILKAKERDEQKRLNLSNPFAVSNEPPMIDRPPYDPSKRQWIEMPQGGTGGGMINSSQEGVGIPANNGQYMAPGQVMVPAGQVMVPAGQAMVPAGQAMVPAGQVMVPAGQAMVPIGQIAAPVGQVVAPVGQIAAPVGQAAVPVVEQAVAPLGQTVAPATTAATITNVSGKEPMQQIQQIAPSSVQEQKPVTNNGNVSNEKEVVNSHPVQTEKAPTPFSEDLAPAKKSDNPFEN